MRHLLLEISVPQDEITDSDFSVLFEDNQGAMRWSTHGVRKAKHVATRQNFVKEHVDSGTVSIRYCPTEHMIADCLTKPLQINRFEYLRK